MLLIRLNLEYQYCFALEIKEEEVRDAVLVTDGDSEIGQVTIFVLQKFLSRLHPIC